jgi:hypothetical protein
MCDKCDRPAQRPFIDAALYAAIQVAILKARGIPEVVAMAVNEIEFRRDLAQLHLDAAFATIDAVVQAVSTMTSASAANAAKIKGLIEKTYNRELVDLARSVIVEAVPKTVALSRQVLRKKIEGKVKGPIAYELPSDLSLQKAPEPLAVATSFTVPDRDAIAAIVEHPLFWIGRYYQDQVSEKIAEIVRITMIERGLVGRQAAEDLAVGLRRTFGLLPGVPPTLTGVPIPGGWRGTPEDYFHMVASNAATVARVYGAMRALVETERLSYTWIAVMDGVTCSRCAALDGKTFPIGFGIRQMNAVLSAKTPEAVKAAQPWHSESVYRKLDREGILKPGVALTAAGLESLAALGIALPPIHASCRCFIDLSDESEVLSVPSSS